MPDDRPLYSRFAGHLDVRPDDKAVLMAVTNQATLLEVDLVSREVLWKYQFADTSGKKRDIYTAKYIYDVGFELNQTKKAKLR
jgi:hypothetical protein